MKLILGLAMALVAPSVQGSQPVQSSGSPAGDVSAQVAVVVASNNAFAFDLYRQLAGQSGNLFLSPYSVELALAMTCAGARGPTASELSGVLRLPADSGTVNAGFGALTGQMDAGAEPAQNVPYSLVVANAIWGQEGYPFRDEFQGIVKNQYRSEARPVDFKATEAACRQINSWVSAQTSGKIASLVQPGVISADTRLVLTNAVYFKS
jgi:serpin B